MGLTSALNIGRSALNYAQAALQVTGNNVANASTPGFTRQSAVASPQIGQRLGPNSLAGGGVYLSAIRRHVDQAVQDRIRSALGDETSAGVRQDLLTQIETLQGELTEADLSSSLARFFNTWSEAANNPSDPAVRALVVQEGVSLAAQVSALRDDYTDVRTQVGEALAIQVRHADELASRVAQLNATISQAEGGQGEASSLRDERDRLLDEMATLLPINVVEQDSGSVNVFVGSTPVVIGTTSRGLQLNTSADDSGVSQLRVEVSADGSDLNVDSGVIGALLTARSDVVDDVIAELDEVAGALIHAVNRAHSQGQGQHGFESVIGTNPVEDSSAVLNSDDAGLPFTVVNGSVQIHLTHVNSQERQTFEIDVDLDGVGSDMSLDDFVAAVNAAAGGAGVTASVTVDGRLSISAANGFEVSFSDDTSGILAATGVNTFFTGTDASDIGINQMLQDDATFLAIGSGHVAGSNGTALEIAALRETGLQSLGGRSLSETWSENVERLSVRSASAQGSFAASKIVRESLEAQRAGVSGVSLDEEAVNLMNLQTQYEAAARYISVIDELTNSLLSIV